MGAFADIISHRQIDGRSPRGGYPIQYVELFGGKIVAVLKSAPDPVSFRDSYYYNSTENVLYKMVGDWVPVGSNLEIDGNFAVVNNRRISVMVNEPDPMRFAGHNFYYNLLKKRLYQKNLRWVVANNI